MRDVVTLAFVKIDGDIVAAPGKIVDAAVQDNFLLWEARESRQRYWISPLGEGVSWMRGAGPDVDGALLAAYALHYGALD